MRFFKPKSELYKISEKQREINTEEVFKEIVDKCKKSAHLGQYGCLFETPKKFNYKILKKRLKKEHKIIIHFDGFFYPTFKLTWY